MQQSVQPRFEVRQLAPGAARRRRLALAAALLVALLVGVAAGFGWTRQGRSVVAAVGHSVTARHDAKAAAAELEDLRQQVVNLKRSEQMARIAGDSLRHTLADREEEISALRADLAFYSRLVGSGGQDGLVLHSVHVAPIAGSRAWNVGLILTQSANRGEENHGSVTLAVEGVENGAVVLLKGKDLGDPEHAGVVPYEFKYFQRLHATVMLPEGFIANRLRVTIQPDGGGSIQHNVTWADALKPLEDSDVQQ